MSASNSNPVPPLGRGNPTPDDTAPDGSEIRLLVGENQGASKSSLVEVTLGTGEVSRPVRHRTVEEVWYVLEGAGKVWRCPLEADPETVPPVDVSPGDSLVIPKDWSFQFKAGNGGPLRFLCHTTPSWPGEDEAVPVEHGGLGDATV
ncbi:MAG: cupin domain-containing protein [SAR202 cluster bacterium]|jgi:mannose-6-phosphate isomerase-like protein (cupin superfamily)|uniref:Cupin type-2 domain-containing protein n=1 Tax=marine metagenome TaxID=408172 RepID=A0A382C6Q3_9ZZZZ|nr:cupin domain-containing protein [Dehalococcoidia bacterium]MQF87517.1 cupin domain-containing protein [SAR202 cluster bacterium]|tara:strand:+ start:127 stop:567 length:441 start_codon:yes stop_codon:yes gene_type:complete